MNDNNVNNNDINELREFRTNRDWLLVRCKLYNIDYERVIELMSDIERQINDEIGRDMDDMRNQGSRFIAKKQMREMINL